MNKDVICSQIPDADPETANRLAGAEMISARAKEIGLENEVILTDCTWDLGQDFKLQHAHRLDLTSANGTVRIYFPDLELTAARSEIRQKRIEDRLRGAISQLLPRSHAPTYATTSAQ